MFQFFDKLYSSALPIFNDPDKFKLSLFHIGIPVSLSIFGLLFMVMLIFWMYDLVMMRHKITER